MTDKEKKRGHTPPAAAVAQRGKNLPDCLISHHLLAYCADCEQSNIIQDYDVWLTCYDDDEVNTCCTPAITSYRVYRQVLGRFWAKRWILRCCGSHWSVHWIMKGDCWQHKKECPWSVKAVGAKEGRESERSRPWMEVEKAYIYSLNASSFD